MAPMDRTCKLNLPRQGLGSFIRDLVYVAGMGLDIWTPNLSSCFLKRGNNKVERKLGMDILRQSAAYCVGFGSVEARCGAPELFAIVTPSTPVDISSCRAFFYNVSSYSRGRVSTIATPGPVAACPFYPVSKTGAWIHNFTCTCSFFTGCGCSCFLF